MSTQDIRDFIHFISIEEENVLKSILNLKDDFSLIYDLDILYTDCLKLKPIGKKELKIPVFLYLNTHREFYLAMSYFLRLHYSKSFCNLRSALDSVFTAYYLIKNPSKIRVYTSKLKEEDNGEWNQIFRNIKATIKRDIKDFPKAEGLPEIHEFCSVFSHSDALGILHRYNEDKEKLMLEAKYFDYINSIKDYKKWLGYLLLGFFKIFLIFWEELFREMADERLNEIETEIHEYDKRIKIFVEKYFFGLKRL